MDFYDTSSWNGFRAFINSQFVSSLFGALGGAFAGAIAAHKIATSSNRRIEIEAQIRAVNTAIMSAFLICNSLLSMKKQQVAKMHDTYVTDKARFKASIALPPIAGTRHFEMDLEYVSVPLVPIETLSKLVYEKLNLQGRPLALVPALEGSLSHLKTTVALRNSLIDQFKSIFPSMSHDEKLKIYFGLPFADGSLRREYSDCIDGIYSYSDDIIYFASLLVSDLIEHGTTIRDKYIKKYRRDIDKISVINFENSKVEEFMPDPKNYEDWAAMFEKLPETPPVPWYRRLRFWSANP